jgi:uncharacterized membrane protein
METLYILMIIACSIASILFIADLIMCDTKEVVWKRKKLTADKARKISNNYSNDIEFIEKEIKQAAKKNKTSVILTINSEEVVKHFEDVGFVITHINKNIYDVDWSNDVNKSKRH